jgi:hypothetical protein
MHEHELSVITCQLQTPKDSSAAFTDRSYRPNRLYKEVRLNDGNLGEAS